MNKRFTFAVCIGCGVQSPPIIIDDAFVGIYAAMKNMDWEFAGFKNNVAGFCPQCKDGKKETIETRVA